MAEPALTVISGGRPARATLEQLYARYGSSVLSRCRFILRDPADAEDAMHDVFAKALTSWAEFRAQASPLTYLMKIATHHCLNVQRSRRAGWRERFLGEAKSASASFVRSGADAADARDVLRKLLSGLDAETQAIAIHYHVDELTLEQVAELVGRSVPTVRKRLRKLSALAEGLST